MHMAFAVLPALPPRHVGVVGLIVSTLRLNVMRTLCARWQRHMGGARASRRQLATIGYDCPDWASLLEGARPRQPNLDEVDPGVPTHGWQFFAASSRGATLQDRCFVAASFPEQALFHSQSGPTSGLPFPSVPSPPTRFTPQFFRVLLLRRLWLALPLSSRAPAVVAVHSTSLTTTVQRVRERESWGVGCSPWRAQRHKVCREAGARVSTNLFVRDLDFPICQP